MSSCRPITIIIFSEHYCFNILFCNAISNLRLLTYRTVMISNGEGTMRTEVAVAYFRVPNNVIEIK
jgi:hypothetical protein